MKKTTPPDLWVDPGTFGGTKACHILADMMNKDLNTYQKRKILSFFDDVNMQFKWISTIEYKPVRDRTMVLMLRELESKVEVLNYPTKFKSFAKNIVKYIYRKNMRIWKE